MEKPANTTTWSNERPTDSFCVECGKKLAPVLLPGFSEVPERWLKITICDPCADKREEEAKRKRRQEEVRQRFGESMLSPRFLKRTFKTFVVNENNRKAYEAAVNFNLAPGGKGLLLSGPPGIGKTHLAAAIANKFLFEFDVLYMSCPEFLQKLRPDNSKANSGLLNAAMKTPLLILNDIGAEKASEWVQETLFLLIDHRYEYELSTVFTTNCSMAQLEASLGPRVLSRISEVSRIIRYEDEDHRISNRLKVVNS